MSTSDTIATGSPVPFPPPNLLPARRIHGIVSTPGKDNDKSGSDHSAEEAHAVPPPSLARKDSCVENVVVVEESTRAYWIQRKISKTTHGSVRVGFVMEPRDDKFEEFQLLPSPANYPFEMVAIKMLDKAKVMETAVASPGSKEFVKDATVELSALQMVANGEWQEECHVVGCEEILADATRIYLIMPYHGDGTLFQYVEEMGRLEEGVARHFFRQILKGLLTLQRLGLCHRSLSLDNVLLRGTDCSLIHLGSSVRVPKGDDGALLLLDPSGACCGHPQYMAPEILRNDPYNGYAIDLWAAGVMLLAMLLGNGAPFVWAAPDDRRFRAICINGNLQAVIQQQYATETGPSHPKKRKENHLSKQAMDLLQSMLRADPAARPTLQEVLEHPWVVEGGESDDDVVPPSISETIKDMNMGRNHLLWD